IMSNYRRYFVPGGSYFFTLVTHERRRFLIDELARQCLRQAIDLIRERRPFEIMAVVLLKPRTFHAAATREGWEWDEMRRMRDLSLSVRLSPVMCQGALEQPLRPGNRACLPTRQVGGLWQKSLV